MDAADNERPKPGRHRAERRSGVPGRKLTVAVSLLVTTALAVSVGVVGAQPSSQVTYLAASETTVQLPTVTTPSFPVNREVIVSRSFSRSIVPFKEAELALQNGGQATAATDLTGTDPRTIAKRMLLQFGFASNQFTCLNTLWNRESHWRVNAHNKYSGAYGIPQALPGSKMSSAGPNWQTDAATQIKWGLGYIKARYGTPCGALQHSNSYGWY